MRSHRSLRPGPRPVLAPLLVAGGFGALVWLSLAVRNGGLLGFNREGLFLFRDPADPLYPLGPHWLESAVRDLTNLGGPALIALVTAAAAGLCLLAGRAGDAQWLPPSRVGALLFWLPLQPRHT